MGREYICNTSSRWLSHIDDDDSGGDTDGGVAVDALLLGGGSGRNRRCSRAAARLPDQLRRRERAVPFRHRRRVLLAGLQPHLRPGARPAAHRRRRHPRGRGDLARQLNGARHGHRGRGQHHLPRDPRRQRHLGRPRGRRRRVRGVGDAQPVRGHRVQRAGHPARGHRQRHRRLLRLLRHQRQVGAGHDGEVPRRRRRLLRHRMLRDAHPHRPPLLRRGVQVDRPEPRERPRAARRGARRREGLVRRRLRCAAQQLARGLVAPDAGPRGAGVGGGFRAARTAGAGDDGLPPGRGEQRVPEQPQLLHQRHRQLQERLRVPVPGRVPGQPVRRRRMPRHRRVRAARHVLRRVHQHARGIHMPVSAWRAWQPSHQRWLHQIFPRFKCRHRNWQRRWPSTPGTRCHFCDPEAEAPEGKDVEAEVLQAKQGTSAGTIGVTEDGHRREDDHPLGGTGEGHEQLRQSSRDRRRPRHSVQRDHVRPARRGDQEVQGRGPKRDRRVHQRGSHPLTDQPSESGEALRVLPRDRGATIGVEFIPNGTLYHHLHVEEPEPSLPWVDQLRIATETARALAYLHSAVSIPIVHRDIKSQNILLDGTLVAKVSDFGASRCIPVDQTGDATSIQGTFGYLDPMYYYSGRLTEKSDVYSFGVLLMELLTTKKPCSYRSADEESLVSYFTALLATGELVHVLDPQVVEEGGKDVEEVAMLAAACVRMEADHRPTTRQVEMTLESLHLSHVNIVMPDMDAPSYVVIKATRTEEVSRQYSLEEEYLLSSRYPR